MFDTFYFHFFVQTEKIGPDDPFLYASTYKFKNDKNESYIIRVEEYKYDVFAIKFYPKSLRGSESRYSILTHRGKPQPILRTCINVILEVLKSNPNASFVFKGVESDGESVVQTKRFIVYRNLMQNFFSPELFFHNQYPKQSIYLLLNRKNTNPKSLLDIENHFSKIFDFGENK